MLRSNPIFIPRARSRFALAVSTAALVTAVAGCGSTTSLVNMWKDPNAPPPMHSVLVIAVQRDQAMRRIWEDGFTKEMNEHGVSAVPSYQLFPGDLPDTQRVIEEVRTKGFDGVLITHGLGTETSSRYVPGYATTAPAMGYDPWYGVYYTYYRRIYEPGYVETERVVRYETDVWATGPQSRLVWSGTTESIDPSSSVSVNRHISDKIIPELVRVGVLSGKR
jgi:hypothetical protein